MLRKQPTRQLPLETEPFERCALTWDLTRLPVPAQLLVYTR